MISELFNGFINGLVNGLINSVTTVMEWPLFVQLMLATLVITFLVWLLFQRTIKYKYIAIDNLFTDTERRFYFLLMESLNGEFNVFAKVRVADVLTPNMKKKHWQGAFNKIKAKHFDYVLCDDNLNILAAIELDDRSHQRADRIARDIFLNKACKTANVPLIRFYTNQDYLPGQIYRQIKSSLR